MGEYSIELRPRVGLGRRRSGFARFFSRPGAIKTISAVIIAGAIAGGAILQPNIPILNPPDTPTNPGEPLVCLLSNRSDWDGIPSNGQIPSTMAAARLEGLSGANCITNATLNVTNQEWSCTQSLASIAAAQGGSLPLKVNITYTVNAPSGGSGFVNLMTGCTGDADPNTVDLVVEIRTPWTTTTGLIDGRDGGVGNGADSLKTRPTGAGPQNIQLTGNFDCGFPTNDAHPDTYQAQHQGDRNINMINSSSGDWFAGHSTCQGAGGMIYTAGGGIHWYGGFYNACNHLQNGTQTAPGDNVTVVDGHYRTALGPNAQGPSTGPFESNCTRANGTPFFNSPPCIQTNNFTTFTNNSCQNRINGQWVEV